MEWWIVAGFYFILFWVVVGVLPKREYKIDRALRAMRPMKIWDVPDGGDVRIDGMVCQHEDILVAPLSERVCVYYDVTVARADWQGDTRTWVELCRQHERIDFRIKDDSGTGTVEICDCAMSVPAGSCTHRVHEARAFVRRCCDAELPNEFRASERVIGIGQRVALAGRARWDPVPGSGSPYRDGSRRLTVKAAQLSDFPDRTADGGFLLAHADAIAAGVGGAAFLDVLMAIVWTPKLEPATSFVAAAGAGLLGGLLFAAYVEIVMRRA